MNIPNEIIGDIYRYLDINSAISLKNTCKTTRAAFYSYSSYRNILYHLLTLNEARKYPIPARFVIKPIMMSKIKSGDIEFVRYLLPNFADFGPGIVHAIIHNRVVTAKLLLKEAITRKMFWNAKDMKVALIITASNGNLKLLKTLIGLAKTYNKEIRSYTLAAIGAAKNKHIDVLQYLLDNCMVARKNAELIRAIVSSGYVSIVENIVHVGTNHLVKIAALSGDIDTLVYLVNITNPPIGLVRGMLWKIYERFGVKFVCEVIREFHLYFSMPILIDICKDVRKFRYCYPYLTDSTIKRCFYESCKLSLIDTMMYIIAASGEQIKEYAESVIKTRNMRLLLHYHKHIGFTDSEKNIISDLGYNGDSVCYEFYHSLQHQQTPLKN